MAALAASLRKPFNLWFGTCEEYNDSDYIPSMKSKQHTDVDLQKLSDSDVLTMSVEQPAVFAVLVERWRSRLLARAARVAGNSDDAEDLVQDTFVRVYKYAKKYSPQQGAEFSSWVYKIFYNVCWSYASKKRNRRSIFVNTSEIDAARMDVNDDSMGVEYADPSFSTQFERLLDLDEVLTTLKRLPRSVSKLIVLHVIDGKNYEELAGVLGVSVATARVRVHRARRDFQQELASRSGVQAN
jgi:RNA polymerase sigma-70 factor (ECF subfamily)